MSVEIISSSRPLDKVEQYLMTVAQSIVTINTLEDGTKITVDAYCTYQDVKENGEVIELLSIMTPDKKVFVTSSETFKTSFDDIADIYEGEQFTIVKNSGVSKAGRKYVVAWLDI